MAGLPTEDDVLRQLNRIESSRHFRNAPVLKKFLRYVTERNLGNPNSDLSISKIAKHVFGLGSEFRNADDSIVRVSAMRLRRTLTLYYAKEGAVDDIIIEMRPGSYRPCIQVRPNQAKTTLKDELLGLVVAYQQNGTRDTFDRAFYGITNWLENEPEDPELLCEYAGLLCDGYGLGFREARDQLEIADSAIQNALIASESSSYHIEFNSGLMGLYLGDLDRLERCGRAIVKLAGDDVEVTTQGRWLIDLAKDPNDRADRQVDLDDARFGWLHHTRFLRSYAQGDYETALSDAIAFGMPQFFWSSLERAAALGQLGLIRSARHEMRRVENINPLFSSEPDRFLSTYIPYSSAREHVLEGLEKAGFRRTDL